MPSARRSLLQEKMTRGCSGTAFRYVQSKSTRIIYPIFLLQLATNIASLASLVSSPAIYIKRSAPWPPKGDSTILESSRHLPIRPATTINIVGKTFMNMTHRLFLKPSLFPLRICGAVPSPSLPIIANFVAAASISTDASDLLLRNDVNSTGITTLTLNNPNKYNILSRAMLDVLQNQLDDIGSDSVRNLL